MVFDISSSQPVSRRPLTQEEFNEFKGELGEFLTDYFSKKAQQQEKKEVDLKIAAQQHAAKAKMHAERADALDAEVQKRREELEKSLKKKITKIFYAIFNGKKELPEEEIQSVFDKYLADKTCSVESKDGKFYSKINHMTGIIKYLDDHPEAIACDLHQFKTEINDIPILIRYIEKSSRIRGIAFDTNISQEIKDSLAQLKASKGAFQVKYFP